MTDQDSPPQPSLPGTAAIILRGWHSEKHEEARLFGERLMALTQEYSRFLDLSRLSKIVLAFDYQAALAEFRDADDAPLGIATSNDFGEGAAMSLITTENGVLQSVLVIWTPLISQLFDAEDTLDKRKALQTYVHELVHVDEQAFLDKTFPGGGASAIQRDERHGALLLMVSPAQAEYAAARRTAYLEPSTGFEFLDMLEKTVSNALSDVRVQRRRYRVREIGLETFWPWVQERGRFIFQSLGYALGHTDGILNSDTAPEDLKDHFRTTLAKMEALELGWLVDATRAAVLPIFDQPEWTGLDVFDPLIDVGERLLNAFGLRTRLDDETLYVEVPLTGWKDL